MPVTTTSAAIHITPVVIKTFFEHSRRKARNIKAAADREEEAQDDIFFDEAFHIVKAFIEMGTNNTVESLQAFTNTHVPAPFWAAVSVVLIPLSSCNLAADILIDWFGPEELTNVVGGERWWQVRGMDGVDGEWITEKKYLGDTEVGHNNGRQLTDGEQRILKMESLDSVMLYVHGGGYFWGSINTHRYQIIRYARKFKGRAFAVNYRKAPQYPWPCPLQDVIAAYLYLTQPPPTALHKPIPPEKIVFAGDSAGGGLCITALTVLRDMGHKLPAGAVLISPWVDLTHSFPSIMDNASTDIIPQHGFLAKPSSLWPVDPLPVGDGRVVPTTSNPPPEPGHSDTLKPSKERVEMDEKMHGHQKEAPAEMLPGMTGVHSQSDEGCDIDKWEPRPPKVLMDDPKSTPLELRSQIQLYATTEQLTHPLVSPILQGSLGNLPPLYIIAGDGEVLRDEIIYLAHRAAHPDEYPARDGVLRDGRRQKDNAEMYTTPTKVHLQVFDGMCHVLTVFTFTNSAKYAYRSIAEFVKHVTSHDSEHLERNPFPELHRPPSDVKPDANSSSSDVRIYKENEDIVAQEVKDRQTHFMPSNKTEHNDAAACSSLDGKKDLPNVIMIRERVDIHGRSRPMEPKQDVQALQLPPGQVGLIKEAPTMRWLKGQREWDHKYKGSAERAIKRKLKYEAKAKKILEHARDQGLILVQDENEDNLIRTLSQCAGIQEDRRWGPLDLGNECPPPSAIAKRRDTPEALALLKKSIYHTAPATHRTVPKLKTSDVIRAAFDPNDDPNKPPRQSVSEQQVRTHVIPVHGLRMWDGIVRYFGRKSSTKALDVAAALGAKAT